MLRPSKRQQLPAPRTNRKRERADAFFYLVNRLKNIVLTEGTKEKIGKGEPVLKWETGYEPKPIRAPTCAALFAI